MPRFFRHISASAFQFGLNQALGLALFYVLSRGLDKNQFGELNWSLAVCLTGFALLGLGLDSLVVKKIAAGEAPGNILALYRGHVRWVGGAVYLALLAAAWAFPGFFGKHYFLLGIALAKTFLFWSLPYKQLAAGRERFGILMRMSVCSTALKTIAVLVCAVTHTWSFPVLIGIFVAGDALEWGVSWWLGRRLAVPRSPADAAPRSPADAAPRAPADAAPRARIYATPCTPADAAPRAPTAAAPTAPPTLASWLTLLREALPQAGVVLFSSAMARFDWIFIGLFVSAASLAEYSFAYKAFEVASLPLLVVAPLLVPMFTRQANEGRLDPADLQQLLRAELIVAFGTVLWLNLSWAPLVNALTAGRYGTVNMRTIFILSLCLPLLYVNNFLWTLHFAHGRLGWILKAFAVAFLFNVGGDLFLIPRYGNEGAALAFLGAVLLQTLLYHKGVREVPAGKVWPTFGLCAACAGLAGLSALRLTDNAWSRVIGATLLYGLALLTWTWGDIRSLLGATRRSRSPYSPGDGG